MTPRRALGLGVACALAACGPRASAPPPVTTEAPPAAPAPPPASTRTRAAEAPAASADEEHLAPEAPEANPRSETVKIKLVADPARKARVFWGRKDLGLAPLELERPRASGPLDLLVVAPGALPLHTRVYTDRDDKLALRLYGESEGPSLLGYHAPVEPPAAKQSGAKAPRGAAAKRNPTPRP